MPQRSVRGVKGVKDLLRKLDRIEGVGRKEVVVKAMKKGSEPIRDAARSKAPVRTGHLKDNIVIEEVRDRNLTGENVAVIAGPGEGLGSRRTFYAHMQEFGTVHHGPQPFMRPAFDEQKRRALRVVRKEIEDELMRRAR